MVSSADTITLTTFFLELFYYCRNACMKFQPSLCHVVAEVTGGVILNIWYRDQLALNSSAPQNFKFEILNKLNVSN